ncbi:MAG: cation:proton antiporter [Rikenellaceae bacterium]
MLESVALLILLSLVLGGVATRIGLPALVGMLLAGIILGQSGFDLLSEELMMVSGDLRQIALVIILMRAGLSLDMESLRKVGRPAVLLSFVPACFEIGAMIFIAPKLLGITTLEAAIMGSVVAAVSPAVLVPKMLTFMEKGIGTKRGIPQMMMASGSIDDLFVIVLFTVFTTLGVGGVFDPAELMQIPVAIGLGLILGVVAGYLMVWLFKLVHIRDTAKLLVLLSVGFLLLSLESSLRDVVSVSALLAIMAMGATVLSRYPILAKRISPKYSKLWVGAEIMLFALVGASVDLGYLSGAGWGVLAVLAFVLVWRMVGVYCSMIGTQLNQRERVFCMVAYIPKATVQAAIGSIPLSMGLECGNIVLTIAIVSIIITAPLGAYGIDACKGLIEEKK